MHDEAACRVLNSVSMLGVHLPADSKPCGDECVTLFGKFLDDCKGAEGQTGEVEIGEVRF